MTTTPSRLLVRQDANESKKGNKGRTNYYGDVLKKKKNSKNLRVIFQNINGIGVNKENDKKVVLKDFINEYNVDCYALAEVNVNWKVVPTKDSLSAYFKENFQNSKVTIAHNVWGNTKFPHQQGGVSIINTGDIALRVSGTQQDPKKLGRWTSSVLRGKHNMTTRIVSVYVPHMKKSKDSGFENVYAQQKSALLQMKIAKPVETVFWEDFWAAIDGWRKNGEQLIVCGDWNDNVYESDIRQQFRERNMHPAITGRHRKVAPPTYNKGRHPIDEIFTTSGLTIQGSGFLQHGVNEGDHCPIWVEITQESALGINPPPIQSIHARRLKLKDPKVVAKYNSILQEEFEKNHIYTRALNLYNQFSGTLTPTQAIEYDHLDELRESAMNKAERKCRKLHMGAIPWSPELQQARNMVQYTKLTLRRKRGRKISARYLMRLSKKVGVNYETVSNRKLEKLLYEALQTYKAMKKEAKQIRESFLEYLATNLEAEGKGKKAQIVRNLKTIEEQRVTFRRLRHLSKKFGGNLNTTSVIITHPSGQKVEITEKDQMEKEIIKENVKKYHQCEDTCPFLQSPLKELFGSYGETPAASKVMEGSLQVPENNNDLTQLFINKCKRKSATTKMNRSVADYKKSWETMKEKTGSHGLHFGHFMAACKHQENMMVHFIMAEVPFRSGYSPSRWKKATNVMILKRAGLFNIEKLRTICLFQSDFNHNNKHLGRQLMQHSVNNKMFAKEQFSVQGKKSITHALNKTLLFDNVRYNKGCLAIASCDLKSCYDRIAHVPAKLAVQSMGVPEAPLLSLFSTLQECQYYTRTVYGDSTTTFGGKEEGYDHNAQGAGQGNGAAPQIWAVLSTKMFEMMAELGLDTSLLTPVSKEEMRLAGFAYVDDSDIFVCRLDENINALVDKLQQLVDNWELAAKVTGGAIAPEKCWWYLLEFEWDKEANYSYKSHDPEQYTLKAKDASNDSHSIKYLDPSTPQEMLGVFISPDGNCIEQKRQLVNKAERYGELLLTSQIYRHEAWIGLNSMAMKSIEYAMPATTLSKDDCKEIMWKLIKNFMPRTGINRYMKRDVLYALPDSQGLGLRNLYLTQGISHVCEIIEHMWKGSITGHLIKTSLEYLRLELGVNIHILKSNISKYSNLNLTQSWLLHTWTFMLEHNITLDIDAEKIPPQREHDIPIMEEIINSGRFSKSQLTSINKCRMYLQAFHLSDIATGDGKKISNNAWHGIKDVDNKGNDCKWPRSGTPSDKMWSTWREALNICYTSRKQQILDNKLGDWLKIPEGWTWFLDEKYNLFKKKSNDSLVMFPILSHSRNLLRHSTESQRCNKTSLQNLHPTTVIKTSDSIISEGISKVIKVPPAPRASRPKYRQWLHYSLKEHEDRNLIKQKILQGQINTVSDGSYNRQLHLGTAAWTILDEKFQPLVSGTSYSPGSKECLSAFRSEAIGVLAILDYLKELCDAEKIQQGSIRMFCDNEKVLQVTDEWSCNRLSSKRKNADILSALLLTRDRLPLRIETQHVKAHQDQDTSINLLSPEAQANVQMDFRAKELLSTFHTCPSSIPVTSTHPLSFVTCKWKNKVIGQETANTLYYEITHHNITQYWLERERFPLEALDFIDFDSVKTSSKSMPLHLKRFMTKWSSECIATGKNMKRWSLRHEGYCPFCSTPVEDTTHILRCQNPQALEVWNTHSEDLFKKLTKLQTCPQLQYALQQDIIAWRNNQPPPSIEEYPISLQHVVTEQRLIGWKTFFEGIMSKRWSEHMTTYYDAKGNFRSSATWKKKVGKMLWEFTYKVWEGRNAKLHETQHIKDMEGVPMLKKAVAAEWKQGLGSLPASEFSALLSSTLDTLLAHSIEYLKQWLLTIRQGRILLDPNNLIHDEFETSKALRSWIGITYTITDKEAQPILLEACTQEHNIGIGNLPKEHFTQHFEISQNQLLKQSLLQLRQWFLQVRQGRILWDTAHLVNDEFMYPGLLRDWIGLE